jgi:hypothetical protein
MSDAYGLLGNINQQMNAFLSCKKIHLHFGGNIVQQ